MSLLNTMRDSLEELLNAEDVPMETVDYGLCRHKNLDNWNYFVFNRRNMHKSGTSGIDYSTFYDVNIIHEDFIPEGYVEKVIKKMIEDTKAAGAGCKLRLSASDITYDYVFKKNTDMVVEIATIPFVHASRA